MRPFAWVEAADLGGALAAGAEPRALFKAGGVDVADRLMERLEAPARLVNIRRVAELDFVREEEGALAVGPLVTLARLAADERIREHARALAEAAGAAATPQIRNRATLGGNLAQRPRCWYFRSELFPCLRKGGSECFAMEGEHELHAIFDNTVCAIVHPSACATALVALGASVRLRSANAQRSLPIEELFVSPAKDPTRESVLLPGEIITGVRVPLRGARSAYAKLMQKQSFDWPLAEVAVALRIEGAVAQNVRIVLGAAAPTPWRATAAERALEGTSLDAAAAAAAGERAIGGATPLPRNRYKLDLFVALVRRALMAAKERA